MVGGDIEANGAGNVFEAVLGQNVFVGVNVQGKMYDSAGESNTYDPVVTASVTNGTFTGYTATASWSKAGMSRIAFEAQISWTSNSGGAGQPYVSLPFFCKSARVPAFIPVHVYATGVTVAAGRRLLGLINTAANRVQLDDTNDTAIGAINVPTGAVDLYISGVYPASVPNFWDLGA
jgi:hypothetical protein